MNNRKKDDVFEHICDVKTASELWGLSEVRIKHLASKGLINAKKFGNRWIIDKSQPNPKVYNVRKKTI